MRRATLRLALLVLALLGAAHPAQAQTPDDGPHIEDGAGDAKEWNTNTVANAGLQAACSPVASLLRPFCHSSMPALGGIDADPSLDILSVTFSDTPDALTVRMELAGLQEAFEGAFAGPADDQVTYRVCWGIHEDYSPCAEAVYLLVRPTPEGAHVSAAYEQYGIPCNQVYWCTWDVPARLQPGSPGALEWTVPRHLLLDPAWGALTSGWGDYWDDEPEDPEEAAAAVNLTGPKVLWFPQAFVFRGAQITEQHVRWDHTGEVRAWGDTSTSSTGLVDQARYRNEHSAVLLSTTPNPAPAAANRDGVDGQGDPDGDGTRPDLDILRLRLAEQADEITVAVQLAAVEETPRDHDLFMALGMPNGHVYRGGYQAAGGETSPWSGTCSDVKCSRWIPVDVRVHTTPGTPGWVNLTFLRAALGDPAPGQNTTLLYASTWAYEPLGEAGGTAVARRIGFDWSGMAPQYRFGASGAPVQEALAPVQEVAGALFEDPSGDAVLPGPLQTAGGSSASHYDVTSLEARNEGGGRLTLTLGVQDLRQVPVPPGYDAVLYAVGPSAGEGNYMVGYYKEKSTPVATGKQAFFCAPDTAVLEETRHDPNDVVWRTIDGFLSLSRSDPGNESVGTGTTGSISFIVPTECLGGISSDPVSLDRLAAGTYLIQAAGGGQGAVTPVDEVGSDGPVLLEAQSLTPAGTLRWYERPFGVENFWDMLGIGAAVLTSAAGVTVVRRKRTALKRYLGEVERAVTAHPDDVRKREEALLAVRARLKEAVVRGQVTEGHYVIVEHRIDEHLAKARVEGVAEAFGDLPHRLVVRLGELLQDGSMSEDDYRLFATLLEDTALTEDAKERIRRKLRYWVREDAT